MEKFRDQECWLTDVGEIELTEETGAKHKMAFAERAIVAVASVIMDTLLLTDLKLDWTSFGLTDTAEIIGKCPVFFSMEAGTADGSLAIFYQLIFG